MINSVQKKILILALFAGEIMMKSGAEIYRVEDTVVRICRACQIDYVECFATTTGIFVSIDSGDEDGDMHTFIKRIKNSEINLDRISAVNTFSRDFAGCGITIEDGFEQLRKIAASPRYNLLVKLIGAFLIGAFFCPIFRGATGDMPVAGCISVLTFLISQGIARLSFPDFIRIFISCICAAGMVLAAATMGLSDSISPIVVAATTIFLPGVAITNAARDLLSGDMVSGVARLAEASITAVAIAGGIGVGIQLWLLSGGSIAHDQVEFFPSPWFLLFGFCSTFGFGIIFNAPKKLLIAVSAIGAVGMFILDYMTTEYNVIAACFFGTCAIAILAEISSRAGKDATTIFIIPGIIPFVPGAQLYETMSQMLVSDFSQAISTGTQALIIAGCIAIALVLVATFARLIIGIIIRIRAFASGQPPPNP
jgi:uncharacterized membrane protein YjjP (DUF1212 family)